MLQVFRCANHLQAEMHGLCTLKPFVLRPRKSCVRYIYHYLEHSNPDILLICMKAWFYSYHILSMLPKYRSHSSRKISTVGGSPDVCNCLNYQWGDIISDYHYCIRLYETFFPLKSFVNMNSKSHYDKYDNSLMSSLWILKPCFCFMGYYWIHWLHYAIPVVIP